MTVPSYTSFEDYLVLEASSDAKHEWCDGAVYAMSRGTPEHARLSMSIGRVLGNVLDKDCKVYSSDAMLYVEGASLSTYANASVVCGALETKTARKNGKSLGEAITNPTLVIEVLSESTERYDRDGKFQATSAWPRSKSTCSRPRTNLASKCIVARTTPAAPGPVKRAAPEAVSQFTVRGSTSTPSMADDFGGSR